MTFQPERGVANSISAASRADFDEGDHLNIKADRAPPARVCTSWGPRPSALVTPGFTLIFPCSNPSPAGQRTLRHRSDVLETVVLVNPCEEALVSEVPLPVLVTPVMLLMVGDVLPTLS